MSELSEKVSESVPREAGAGGAIRRRQLIEATIDAIAESGLSRLTVARVGQGAGLTGAMVNFHFRSKEALLLETLRFLYEEYEAKLAEALRKDTPEEALEAVVDMHFDPDLSDARKIAVWTAFWGESRAREEYMAVCGHRDVVVAQQVLSLCSRIIERDHYQHLHAKAISAGLTGLLETTWQSLLVDDGIAVRASGRQLCKDYLCSLFPRTFAGAEITGATLEPREPQGLDSGESERAGAPEVDWDRRMLPPWVYASPEFTELEKEKVFRRHWLMVGHQSEIARVGDFLSFDVVGERVLVIRGADGEPRAFHNVCRHRASRVVRALRGSCERAIVCPFHGWSYGLDGKLLGVPSAKSFKDLDYTRLGLKRVELELWHGFVFVRFGGEGASVASLLGPYEEELARYRLDELEPCGEYWEQELDLDWKVVHDVDNEGYHVPVAHPGLQRLVGSSYHDEVLDHRVTRSSSTLSDRISSGWSERMYQKLLPSVEHLPETHRRAWMYYGLFPNLSIGLYPDLVGFFQAFPTAHGHCLLRGRNYALPDARREMRAARYLNRRINHAVGAEDIDLMRWSAAGMQTLGFERAHLSDKEKGVRWMHDGIREAIPVARLESAPPPGRVAEVNREMGG